MPRTPRKICVITGTRAEYGLLRWVMQGIKESSQLELQVIATGMHLSPEFGETYREIEADGFRIDRKIEMLLSSDTPVAISKSIGIGVIGFADVFRDLQPDLVVLLGDRFEALAAVSAALVAQIPVAHLHGGELTEGAMDDAIRHAITKMSHVHFVAAEEYRRRVIQLGESPERVHCVGGLGVDAIKHVRLLDKGALEARLGFEFKARNLLVTFHPETLSTCPAADQLAELLAALDGLEETGLIFTYPNADAGGRQLISMLEGFVAWHPDAKVFTSLGQQGYLSCMALSDGVVGNSSSGLLEAPSFRKGTINIGDRQRGRLQAESVINSPAERTALTAAISRLYAPEFQAGLVRVTNPYGDGGASWRILEVIREVRLEGLLAKGFHDFPANGIGAASEHQRHYLA